ncbi:hypothetical protein E5675_16205 [Sphingopyxis sp. PAMC25046]|nr:hypothetical protein E5675_16205 [Sphingopyxis sp. PAMC25046]
MPSICYVAIAGRPPHMCMLRRKAVAQILEFVLNARHHSRSGLRLMSAIVLDSTRTRKRTSGRWWTMTAIRLDDMWVEL